LIPFSEIGKNDAFVRFLPLVGTLAAGFPFRGMETNDLSDVVDLDWVEVPRNSAGKNRYVVRVAGRSMEPEFNVGDLLVFEYHRTPREDGQVVIANVAEFGMTNEGVEAIKRLRQDADNWIFESDNPEFQGFMVSKAETRYPILGTFVVKL
jgi:SOS-response transcriptional repressor LexA